MPRIEASLQRRDRLASIMREVYSGTEYLEQSHTEMLKTRTRRVFHSKDWKLSPHWVKSFVEGVESELRERIYNQLIEWVLIGPDGRMFRKGNDDWLKGSHVYRSSMVGFHVWLTSLANNRFAIWS